MRYDTVQERVKAAQVKLGNNGRVLLRYSGTEKLARVMVEGPSESAINEISSDIAEALEKDMGSIV